MSAGDVPNMLVTVTSTMPTPGGEITLMVVSSIKSSLMQGHHTKIDFAVTREVAASDGDGGTAGSGAIGRINPEH
jgi:hypothetical protein